MVKLLVRAMSCSDAVTSFLCYKSNITDIHVINGLEYTRRMGRQNHILYHIFNIATIGTLQYVVSVP